MKQIHTNIVQRLFYLFSIKRFEVNIHTTLSKTESITGGGEEQQCSQHPGGEKVAAETCVLLPVSDVATQNDL